MLTDKMALNTNASLILRYRISVEQYSQVNNKSCHSSCEPIKVVHANEKQKMFFFAPSPTTFCNSKSIQRFFYQV
jgi:hypothetical protein